jgi:hypothetical protein
MEMIWHVMSLFPGRGNESFVQKRMEEVPTISPRKPKPKPPQHHCSLNRDLESISTVTVTTYRDLESGFGIAAFSFGKCGVPHL